MSNKTPSDNLEKTASELKPRKYTRIIVLYLLVTLILGFVIGIYLRQNRNNSTSLCADNMLPTRTRIDVHDYRLQAEVASSSAEKTQGLSGRKCMETDTAMLFPYPSESEYCFWMKDMRFPIDMVWLDDEKKVVTIVSGVSPDSYPQTYCPDMPAQYVVEVEAGVAKRLGWMNGTQFSF